MYNEPNQPNAYEIKKERKETVIYTINFYHVVVNYFKTL